VEDSNAYIQKLNDEYTNPSGEEKTELPIEELAVEDSKPREALGADAGPAASKS